MAAPARVYTARLMPYMTYDNARPSLTRCSRRSDRMSCEDFVYVLYGPLVHNSLYLLWTLGLQLAFGAPAECLSKANRKLWLHTVPRCNQRCITDWRDTVIRSLVRGTEGKRGGGGGRGNNEGKQENNRRTGGIPKSPLPPFSFLHYFPVFPCNVQNVCGCTIRMSAGYV